MKFADFVFVATVLQLAVSSPAPYYKKLSPEEVERLASWTPDDKQPMWELSGQYQGDMVLLPEQRNGLIDTRYRWSNRELVYEISSEYTAQEKQVIIDTLQSQYSKTCTKTRQRTAADTDYVYVTANKTGCFSNVGRIGGRQILNLERPGCVNLHTVTHEFLHAFGFEHQHCATERDDYVTIHLENVQDGQAHNFNKYGPEKISSFGQTYDYGSVMHYSKYAFSKNQLPTILPKDPNATIGFAPGLSSTDIIKLNKMYNCA